MVRWHSDSMHVSLRTFQETVKDRGAWHAVVRGVAKSQHDLATQQQPTNIYLVPAMIKTFSLALLGGCAKVQRTGPFP